MLESIYGCMCREGPEEAAGHTGVKAQLLAWHVLGSAASWAELCLHMTVAPIPSNYVELLCARVCSASEKG